MQVQKLLTLRWRLLLRDSSDLIARIFGPKGGDYFDYVLQRPCLLLDYPTHKTKNRWRIVDAYFHDWSMSKALSFSRIKTANTLALEGCNYAAVCLPKM